MKKTDDQIINELLRGKKATGNKKKNIVSKETKEVSRKGEKTVLEMIQEADGKNTPVSKADKLKADKLIKEAEDKEKKAKKLTEKHRANSEALVNKKKAEAEKPVLEEKPEEEEEEFNEEEPE